jgi:hypothetical protein
MSVLLFIVQIVFAVIFGGGQLHTLLTKDAVASPTWYGLWVVFSIFSVRLALDSYRRNRTSRDHLFIVIIYLLWLVLILADFLVVIFLRWHWGLQDTINSVVALLTTGIVWAIFKDLTLPTARGWLSAAYKAVPQFTLAGSLLFYGPGSVASTSLITGFCNIGMRVYQTYLQRKNDPAITALLVSELANWASFWALIICWIIAH